MKFLILAITLSTLCQAEVDKLTSPNGQYKIEYIDALPHETNVELKNAKTGKVLDSAISYGYDPENYREIAWSPNSRYLAVITRGTRTSIQVQVFSFVDDKVDEITMPIYRVGDGSWKGGRSSFNKHIKWDGTTLTFYCYGDKFEGAGNLDLIPEDWYHYDITMRFGELGKAADPKVISIVATKPKWQGEQDAALKAQE